MELLTHHLGRSHGDVEASGMVFFLWQGARTGTTISSRDQNRDGRGTGVGFEKRVPYREVLGRKINIGQRGSQEVALGARAARWHSLPGARARRAPPPGGSPPVEFRAFGCLQNKRFFWNFSEHI